MFLLWLLLQVLLLLLGVGILIYLRFLYSYKYWKRKGVPFLEPSFPFGTAEDLVKERLSFGEFGAKIYKDLKKKTSSFGGFYIFNGPVLMPIDPELIKCILSKDFHTFHDRGLYFDEDVDPLSGHLVNLSGQKWKRLRGKLTPVFTSGKIKMMFQILQNCSEEMVKVLEEFCGSGQPFNFQDLAARLTTDNIGSCAFGIDCNSLKYPDAEFRQYGKLLIDTTFSDQMWQVFAINFPAFMKIFKIPIINKKVSKFFMEALRQTVEERERTKVERKDFVDLFIKLKKESIDDDGKKQEGLTFNELAAQAFAFFIGGFETSGTTLAFLMYELSNNQTIQQKLREEIFHVLKKHSNEITYEALMEMPYLDKVLSETLRKYPVLPMLNRVSNREYQLPGTDITIKKNIPAFVSVLGLHYDPEYYPQPEKFDPERFSEEEKSKRHPFTYLPFGEGPRICIGMRFGLLQVKVAVVNLIKNYKFCLDSKTGYPMKLNRKGILISPESPIFLHCTNFE